jgi:hypothetical protein
MPSNVLSARSLARSKHTHGAGCTWPRFALAAILGYRKLHGEEIGRSPVRRARRVRD